MTVTTKKASKGRPRTSDVDVASTRNDILRVAHQEFATQGFSGASINAIAEKISTTKRMIYYHFTDKEHLYREVLQSAYEEMRKGEAQLNLEGMDPVAALRRLVEFTFDHHWRSPEFIRLVMIENIHHAEHLQQIARLKALNSSTVERLQSILQRGLDSGVFREGIKAVELHWQISALCFFNVSNRSTFSYVHGDALFNTAGQRRLRAQVTESILRLVAADGQRALAAPASASEAGGLNPQILDFLAEWDNRWAQCPPNSGPAARRAFFETVAEAMRLPTPPKVSCDDVHWVRSSAGDVRVRIFRWQGAPKRQPALIYLHGGAFMQGSPETHWDITARLAAWAKMTVISVDYAKAPERPFPTALYQCADVIKWAHAEASQLGIDPQRISWGGDSAGGNLAASLGLMFRGTRHAARANLLVYPACDFDKNRDSFIENKDGPLIKVAGMDAVNRMYCPNESDLRNPLAAPLLAQDHSGLPPTFVAVAQFDPLRDSGLAYHDALVQAGVDVTLDRGEGLCHGYLRGMGHAQVSVDKLKLMAAWLAAQHV
jgi:acetyl esterase/lipase